MLRRLWVMLTENDVEAGNHPDYPDIVPVTLRGDQQTVLRRVRRAFEQGGKRWKVVSHDPREGKLIGIVTTPVFGFVDDFSVRLEPVEASEEPRGWLVRARSCSRVGKGDLGKNARNLRAFYDRLNELVGSLG